jgi:hypothetical protein
MIFNAISNILHRPRPICSAIAITLAALLTFSTGAEKCNAEETNATKPQNHLLKYGQLTHIPGPNPILQPVDEGWDCVDIEAADAFKDLGKYYLYYHGTGKERELGIVGYRIGVVVADHPLGPFKRISDTPLIHVGPKGSWDDKHTACAMVLKEGTDKYYMWYSGSSDGKPWSIGLATASHPMGPWKKHKSNPIIKDFGYVGSVIKKDGQYFMYNAHPIGSTGADYSPLSMAVADKPEGPWKLYDGNPIMKQGEWSEWDDGGISEAEVMYHSGVFHMFYGGSKLFDVRRHTRESIGYAYSLDGYNFTKYGLNPVVTRRSNPNVGAFAEVHGIFEAPFIYLYHTIRYKTECTVFGKHRPLGKEDIGVQVLAIQSPFTLDMPVLNMDMLAAGESTPLGHSPALGLDTVDGCALTIECKYSSNAEQGVRLHVRSSYDGFNYDTEDLFTFDSAFQPGGLSRKTFEVDTGVRFIKVMLENLDENGQVTNVKVTATLRRTGNGKNGVR